MEWEPIVMLEWLTLYVLDFEQAYFAQFEYTFFLRVWNFSDEVIIFLFILTSWFCLALVPSWNYILTIFEMVRPKAELYSSSWRLEGE